MAAVLADRDVLFAIKKGDIIITPFNRDFLSNCSYDVTLGENYYRSDIPIGNHDGKPVAEFIFNPWSESATRTYWGKPNKAKEITEANAAQYSLRVGQKYILISPGETLLCHTQEFIGGRNCITTMMKARSSLGRCGISVCRCAGWGDIGYINRWTMEITNASRAVIVLPVGYRVAQIVFLLAGVPERPYNGKYQNSFTDINSLKQSWRPSMMLPHLYQEADNIPHIGMSSEEEPSSQRVVIRETPVTMVPIKESVDKGKEKESGPAVFENIEQPGNSPSGRLGSSDHTPDERDETLPVTSTKSESPCPSDDEPPMSLSIQREREREREREKEREREREQDRAREREREREKEREQEKMREREKDREREKNRERATPSVKDDREREKEQEKGKEPRMKREREIARDKEREQKNQERERQQRERDREREQRNKEQGRDQGKERDQGRNTSVPEVPKDRAVYPDGTYWCKTCQVFHTTNKTAEQHNPNEVRPPLDILQPILKEREREKEREKEPPRGPTHAAQTNGGKANGGKPHIILATSNPQNRKNNATVDASDLSDLKRLLIQSGALPNQSRP